MERECLDCGSLLRGRSDKKFCDDQCRSHYNNGLRLESSSALRPVNAILRKNHSILTKLCVGNKIRMNREDLLRYGFNMNYHTHLNNNKDGHTCYFCYDYGYISLDEDLFLLVKDR